MLTIPCDQRQTEASLSPWPRGDYGSVTPALLSSFASYARQFGKNEDAGWYHNCLALTALIIFLKTES